MGPEYENSEPYRLLYKAMREALYEIKTERSNITRGWTYNSPIFKMIPNGVYPDQPEIPRHRFVPMGAGSGLNPLSALIDAVKLTRERDPRVLVAVLEAELWLLDRAYRVAREREEREALTLLALDQTLDGLTAILRSVNVPDDDWHGDIPLGQARPITAKPDEDDDL